MEVGARGRDAAAHASPRRSTAPTSFFGLSVKGALTRDMVRSMAPNPIIFAMANPDPEITPEEVAAIRDDAIMATGRSDYPNQVNNVLGFPYIFRGALDVRATHDQHGDEDRRGPGARRARPRGRARRGRRRLSGLRARASGATTSSRCRSIRASSTPCRWRSPRPRWTPAWRASRSTISRLQGAALGPPRPGRRHAATASSSACASFPKRVVFAEGEEEQVIRAAISFVNQGLGTAILSAARTGCSRPPRPPASISKAATGIEIHNARLSRRNSVYAQFLYERLQRQRLPVPRLPAHDQPGPQPFRRLRWWRSATPTRW